MSNLRDTITVPNYTSFVGSGGSSVTYVNEGLGKNGRNILTELTNPDVRMRNFIQTNLIRPAPAANIKSNPTFGHAQGRFTLPFSAASGKIENIQGFYDLGSHPEYTEALRVAMLYKLVNLLLAPDLQNLNVKGVHV